jgi:hypothetical protein
VRAYNGQRSRWYQAAKRQKAGRITVAGMTREVAFELGEGPINDRIDDIYREKYRSSEYLAPILLQEVPVASTPPRNMAITRSGSIRC